MTATYVLSNDIAKVRLLISDTDVTPATDAHFTDAEITAFLTMASTSLLLAASYALEAWAASVTDGYTSERIGDYAYTKKEADAKMALAKKYRDEDAKTPYLTWSEWDLNIDGLAPEDDQMWRWSAFGCQVWVKNWRRQLCQCPYEPVIAKESVLLCRKHQDLRIAEGRAVQTQED